MMIGWRPATATIAAACALALVPAAGSRAEGARPRGAPAPATPAAASRVLGKKDIVLRGAPACDVRFVYAGRAPETLFREEPCAAVTATMATPQELKARGRWDRLDAAARRFVAAQGGRVLYVEGRFSASVYPVGTTGATYEVTVAD